MATDYDAPRVRAEDETTDSLEQLVTSKAAARTADGALAMEDSLEDLEVAELPDAFVDGELQGTVVPQQSYEARCTSCFLVRHASTLDADGVCSDCR